MSEKRKFISRNGFLITTILLSFIGVILPLVLRMIYPKLNAETLQSIDLIILTITFFSILLTVAGFIVRIFSDQTIKIEEMERKVQQDLRVQGRLLEKKGNEFQEKLETAVRLGKFYRIDAHTALDHITDNLRHYTHIKNIRLRPINDIPKSELDWAGKRWRDEIEKAIREDFPIEIIEIIADEESLKRNVNKLICIQSKKKEPNTNYYCKKLPKYSGKRKLHIRNYTILHKKHLGKEDDMELYWGWHSNKDEEKFYTYYTRDRAMIFDYVARFTDMKRESLEIPIEKINCSEFDL